MSKKNRLKVLEKSVGKPENIVKEITINFINMDGSIASTMIRRVGANHKVK